MLLQPCEGHACMPFGVGAGSMHPLGYWAATAGLLMQA